jgi:hypothetical protein
VQVLLASEGLLICPCPEKKSLTRG